MIGVSMFALRSVYLYMTTMLLESPFPGERGRSRSLRYECLFLYGSWAKPGAFVSDSGVQELNNALGISRIVGR